VEEIFVEIIYGGRNFGVAKNVVGKFPLIKFFGEFFQLAVKIFGVKVHIVIISAEKH